MYHGDVPWPEEAIHPDEVPDLIHEGQYDEAVLERAAVLKDGEA